MVNALNVSRVPVSQIGFMIRETRARMLACQQQWERTVARNGDRRAAWNAVEMYKAFLELLYRDLAQMYVSATR